MKTVQMIMGMLIYFTLVTAEEFTPKQKELLGEEALRGMAQEIFSKAMEAKRAYLADQFREEAISNFATTAPRSEFIVNADISAELQEGTESATVYVSTDGQSTWQSAPAEFIGTEGYETTWGGTIATNEGADSFSYLAGVVNSEVLGESFGTIIVSGTPHNVNGNWPPGSNLYAHLVDEPSGDASSDYDITDVFGTYQGHQDVDNEGEDYTAVDRFYLGLTIDGGCCYEGSLFGPWYLYGVGIVNPEAEEAVAYAIGYGNGGFGELYPGLLKLSGDLTTGELDGFEYITTNISYSTAGDDLQATALMSYLTNDSQWGLWPNSFNGFIVLGVTVEASLDGLDVAIELLDQTNPGLMVCSTPYQDGNIELTLSEPDFDSETNTLSITYSDGDGNLPWYRAAQVCNTPENGGNCFLQLDMIPDSHTYEDGVRYSASFDSSGIEDGDYAAHFWFADDNIIPDEQYHEAQIVYPITIGGGGCALSGDVNGDTTLNVLDIVLLVNIILTGQGGNDCADVNGDTTFNVLDIVLLVNLILGGGA